MAHAGEEGAGHVAEVDEQHDQGLASGLGLVLGLGLGLVLGLGLALGLGLGLGLGRRAA